MPKRIFQIKNGKYWKKENGAAILWFEFTPEEVLERCLYLEGIIQKDPYYKNIIIEDVDN